MPGREEITLAYWREAQNFQAWQALVRAAAPSTAGAAGRL